VLAPLAGIFEVARF